MDGGESRTAARSCGGRTSPTCSSATPALPDERGGERRAGRAADRRRARSRSTACCTSTARRSSSRPNCRSRARRSNTKFRKLMIAQDTGSAIIGPARADIYFGAGDEAGKIAGRIKTPGAVRDADAERARSGRGGQEDAAARTAPRIGAEGAAQRRDAAGRSHAAGQTDRAAAAPASEIMSRRPRALQRRRARAVEHRHPQRSRRSSGARRPRMRVDEAAPAMTKSQSQAAAAAPSRRDAGAAARRCRRLRRSTGAPSSGCARHAAIDARLDLHGLTQAEAHGALARFLRARRRDDAKMVLVITGKGARDRDGEGRGVLKRQVPLWLAGRSCARSSSASRAPASATAAKARSMCGCGEGGRLAGRSDRSQDCAFWG